MEMKPYIVYVKADSSGQIVAVDSSAFLRDVTGWVKIDDGYGDKYHHAQGNYFPKAIMTKCGACRYRLADGKVQEYTAEEIAAQEEAKKAASTPMEVSVWDALDAAYQKGVNSL